MGNPKTWGYSEANALQFSQEQAAAHGWPKVWRSEYVPHVLRYYSGGGLFAGLFGKGQLVTIAKSQLGNEGGQKFWSWYGFDSQGRMVCLFCQLVCGSGRTYSKGSSAKVFCLYGRCGFVSGKEKMAKVEEVFRRQEASSF